MIANVIVTNEIDQEWTLRAEGNAKTKVASMLPSAKYPLATSTSIDFASSCLERAMRRLRSALKLLWPRYVDRRLAPETSTLWLLARVAYHRSRSGLMVLSAVPTNIQLGLLLHAAVVITA